MFRGLTLLLQLRRSTPSGLESAALKVSSTARSVLLPGGLASEASCPGAAAAIASSAAATRVLARRCLGDMAVQCFE